MDRCADLRLLLPSLYLSIYLLLPSLQRYSYERLLGSIKAIEDEKIGADVVCRDDTTGSCVNTVSPGGMFC